ncbi:MAG: phosphoglycerate dehydrogenase, partial [Actinobacteria bacterium]|nr:phosphoglycerate dehydrogenase [Actinomycetota bacterium]
MEHKQKILITEDISEEAVKILSEEFEVDVKKDLTASELDNEIKGYDGLIIKSPAKISSETINNAGSLK